MPWFQRKARPWDSHWDLYTHYANKTISNIHWTWPVPDDYYLQLTHVHLRATFGFVGLGTIHYPEIACLRGTLVRWATAWEDKTISGTGRIVTFANVPLKVNATKTLQAMYVPLPTPCYLIPGDLLRVGWWGYVAGDFLYYVYLTFKAWRIY